MSTYSWSDAMYWRADDDDVVQHDDDDDHGGTLAWCPACQQTRTYTWDVNDSAPACQCGATLDASDWT